MYANGRGVDKDDAEAVKWFRLAADQGYAAAQCNLGVMYANGQGIINKDEAEAVKWYRLAADQGYALAQYNLGVMYAQQGNDYLFSSNIVKAVVAYEQALANNPETSGVYHNLACCYFIQGELKKADTCFQKGIALHSTPDILTEYGHFLVIQKRFNEALLYLQQCLSHSEDGELNYALGEINTAVTAIQQMIKAQPDLRIIFSAKGLALYLQAYCHLELKSDNVAIAQRLMDFEGWIEKADNTDQEEGQAIQHANYYFLLGDIYEKAEDRTQAQSYYEKARQLNQEFAKIIKIPSMEPIFMRNNQPEISDVRLYYPSGSPIHSYKREEGAITISEETENTINSNSEDEFSGEESQVRFGDRFN